MRQISPTNPNGNRFQLGPTEAGSPKRPTLLGWAGILLGLVVCCMLPFDRPAAATAVETPATARAFMDGTQAVDGDPISYNDQIRPILANHCFACHGFDAASRMADLRLDTRAGALESGSGDAIVPGDPESSEVVQRIDSVDPGYQMPPPEFGKPLDAAQQELLRQWIQQGAVYQRHWAFEALTPPGVPDLEFAQSTQSTQSQVIDHWVEVGQRAAGLSFSPPAAPETLLRRISLDLIGLPPTLSELDDFLAEWAGDPEAAYVAAVERLLDSPHYGERWARWWLDQARYADSHGYSIDAPRQIWLYRDWVIQAFNQDLTFDQFTIQQLAGDLLPDATLEQQIATGFHRNTQLNQEGGIDVEQFRVENVVDRVATTGTVWMGLTIGCAQCHDHKFDPILQEEFYQLFAFFNQQDEPTLTVSWQPGRLGPIENVDVAELEEPPLEEPPLEEPPPEVSESVTAAPEIREVRTLVLRQRRQPRPTHVLIQGDFTRPAQAVQPGTPAILPPLPPRGESPDRLDLARWLVAPENPLTARVMVNRVWQQIFGRGLVESDDDFGLQGSVPTHPELLDSLAVAWRESGWRWKELHRWIVMSKTYRQSSVVTEQLSQRDPYNRWLARQQRIRLDAELVRDAALLASGLLSRDIGGPPVYPPIPAGVLDLGQVQRTWPTSQGSDRYRRSLYTFRYRATPPPMLSVFDAPDGVQSCTRRIRSNTPLQALTLLNDAGLFEMAQQLAELVETEGLETAFRRCTARRPTADEFQLLADLTPLAAARVLLNLDETISRE